MTLDPLPPLTALRAFDAAARHNSFTKAAEELHMTQAAVSYQIKLLEDRFGEPLFVRSARQVTLSEAGARLAPSVMEAFEIIRRGFAEAKGRRDDLLTITMVQTFASAWLARHLGGFQIYNGDVAVKIDISSHLIHDFQAPGWTWLSARAMATGRGLYRKSCFISITPLWLRQVFWKKTRSPRQKIFWA